MSKIDIVFGRLEALIPENARAPMCAPPSKPRVIQAKSFSSLLLLSCLRGQTLNYRRKFRRYAKREKRGVGEGGGGRSFL